jgi:hypothetical protein
VVGSVAPKSYLRLADKPDWWVKGVFNNVTTDLMVRELQG